MQPRSSRRIPWRRRALQGQSHSAAINAGEGLLKRDGARLILQDRLCMYRARMRAGLPPLATAWTAIWQLHTLARICQFDYLYENHPLQVHGFDGRRPRGCRFIIEVLYKMQRGAPPATCSCLHTAHMRPLETVDAVCCDTVI